MFLYSKNKKFIKNIILLLYLPSCVNVIESPVKKYNTEFLRTNARKINRSKNKHLNLAKQQNIYYRINNTDAIDNAYYKKTNGSKLKKNYRYDDTNIKNEEKPKELKYLGSDLSIYYKQRNLKDDSDFIKFDEDHSQFIMYLAENYPDYSKERISFGDIKPSSDMLYGNLKLRKEKEYKYIDNQTMQENFDYIDIMNRVKKEVYLENKKQEIKDNINNKKTEGTLTTIKNKFMNLFK